MSARKHICTVQFQEYFQHKVFKRIIQNTHWAKLEGQIEKDLENTFDLLDKTNTRATFFTSGWMAERHPQLIKRIDQKGHELACIGYYDLHATDCPMEEFLQDVRRSKYILEDLTGKAVIGYRSIHLPLFDDTLTVLEQLYEEGFVYDSSYRNHYVSFSRKSKDIISQPLPQVPIKEIAFPTLDRGIIHFPVGGGNYLRQFPQVVKFYYNQKDRANGNYMLYFHPWELNSELPEVTAFDRMTKIRIYRNLGKVTRHIEEILGDGEFTSIRDYLGEEITIPDMANRKSITSLNNNKSQNNWKCREEDFSLIIPCYNEVDSIEYLRKHLDAMEVELGSHVRIHYIFVNDNSSDDTVSKLEVVFRDKPTYKIISHEKNKGVAGAIRTGIEAAETELLATIDADCSYDPMELISMFSLLSKEEDIALVTASPYHKRGHVFGVPEWRLFLSRGLSGLYKGILNHKFATYTACFRVYRRSLILDKLNDWGDFRGILELLVRLDFSGCKLAEFPTTLHSRIFGFSKMKTLKTIRKHLEFMASLKKLRRSIKKA